MDSLRNIPIQKNACEEEFWPLSGQPCFNVILRKTHMRPTYTLYLPAKVSASLPPFTGPLFLTYRGKKWKIPYTVDRKEGRRTTIKWRDFAIDNQLKEGDACVFELTECSNTGIKIRVQILKGDFPSQLLNSLDGAAPDKPIIL
ncbi:B3 domain-containing protein [Heracleum sosnowskyi]|uniref:B3 domain-containing protein n=1 Tax=Heracleum sosnowskyi TaxID=360622 RepID=A0AAD8JFA8_9APIA|nr:B3 domain-containing protein [Heracleum sosnowskyi]